MAENRGLDIFNRELFIHRRKDRFVFCDFGKRPASRAQKIYIISLEEKRSMRYNKM